MCGSDNSDEFPDNLNFIVCYSKKNPKSLELCFGDTLQRHLNAHFYVNPFTIMNFKQIFNRPGVAGAVL